MPREADAGCTRPWCRVWLGSAAAGGAEGQAREPFSGGVPGGVARARVARGAHARRVGALARLPAAAAHLADSEMSWLHHRQT